MNGSIFVHKICVTCSLVSEEDDQISIFISSSSISINIYAICSIRELRGLTSWWSIFIFLEREWISDMCQVYQLPFCCLEKHRDDFFLNFKICLCLIIRNETLKNGKDYPELEYFCVNYSLCQIFVSNQFFFSCSNAYLP